MIKTDRVNNWLTLAANVGVLVGIAFLITELQQTNRIATNEAESNVTTIFLELNSTLRANSPLLSKLTDETSILTEVEKIEAKYLGLEIINALSLANTAGRNGLITDYLLEIYLSNTAVFIEQYPKLGQILNQIHKERFSEIDPGTSLLIDRLREELTKNGFAY